MPSQFNTHEFEYICLIFSSYVYSKVVKYIEDAETTLSESLSVVVPNQESRRKEYPPLNSEKNHVLNFVLIILSNPKEARFFAI